MSTYFPHERLDAYRRACSVARRVRATPFPRGDAPLKDQAKRAADSVVLNLAEGVGRAGKDRQRHFRIAIGSAAEASAVFDLVDLPGGAESQAELRRVAAMLRKLR